MSAHYSLEKLVTQEMNKSIHENYCYLKKKKKKREHAI